MAKGKKKRNYRRRARNFFRRRSKAKIPLEVAVTGISIPFVPVADGWNTPLNYALQGDYQGLGLGLAKAFTGIDMSSGGPGTNVLSIINPFDLNSARYTKMLLYAGLISKFRKKLVRIPFDKIPIVGKYVS